MQKFAHVETASVLFGTREGPSRDRRPLSAAPLPQRCLLQSRAPFASGDEKRFRHFVRGPGVWLARGRELPWAVTYQQIAVLGIVVMILGFRPRKYPRQPSL